jgi:hypothetical protein
MNLAIVDEDLTLIKYCIFDCVEMIVMNFFWQVMIKDVVRKVFTNILIPTQDLRQGNGHDCIFRMK